MRTPNDCTYQEHKEGVAHAFALRERDPANWSVENVTNFLVSEEYNVPKNPFAGATRFLFFVALGEYEIRKGILEERVLTALSYHIHRFENMNKYIDDLEPDEILEVKKDIFYIKENVELPELETYEDME